MGVLQFDDFFFLLLTQLHWVTINTKLIACVRLKLHYCVLYVFYIFRQGSSHINLKPTSEMKQHCRIVTSDNIGLLFNREVLPGETQETKIILKLKKKKHLKC